MKKIEFAAARPYAAPSCKLVKMMPRQVVCQSGGPYNSKGMRDFGDDADEVVNDSSNWM